MDAGAAPSASRWSFQTPLVLAPAWPRLHAPPLPLVFAGLGRPPVPTAAGGMAPWSNPGGVWRRCGAPPSRRAPSQSLSTTSATTSRSRQVANNLLFGLWLCTYGLGCPWPAGACVHAAAVSLLAAVKLRGSAACGCDNSYYVLS